MGIDQRAEMDSAERHRLLFSWRAVRSPERSWRPDVDGHSLQLAPRSARRRRTPTPETGASETAGGHIDRPQFADYATARGWTNLGELVDPLSRRGVQDR